MFTYPTTLLITSKRLTAIFVFAVAVTVAGGALAQQSPTNGQTGSRSTASFGGAAAVGDNPNYRPPRRFSCLVTNTCRRDQCECKVRSGKRSCRYPTVSGDSIVYRICRPKG